MYQFDIDNLFIVPFQVIYLWYLLQCILCCWQLFNLHLVPEEKYP